MEGMKERKKEKKHCTTRGWRQHETQLRGNLIAGKRHFL